MTELEGFSIYDGEKEVPFQEMSPSEQRVAMIAAGALLRGGSRRAQAQLVEQDGTWPENLQEPTPEN